MTMLVRLDQLMLDHTVSQVRPYYDYVSQVRPIGVRPYYDHVSHVRPIKK